MKFIDLTGQQYSRLTVLTRAPNRNRCVMWYCRCRCGNFCTVASIHLTKGNTRSCGCFARDRLAARALPEGMAAFNSLYSSYRNNARIHKPPIPFELTEEDFSFITKMNCHYCGAEPSQEYGRRGLNGNYIYNGIDRLNNTKGYTLDNVVPCCGICNRAKGNKSRAEFIAWVGRVYNSQYRLNRLTG